MKWYEIMIEFDFGCDYAICIRANHKPTKEEIYAYLKKYEYNAQRFEFSADNIKYIEEIAEEEMCNLYNTDYIYTLPIMN